MIFAIKQIHPKKKSTISQEKMTREINSRPIGQLEKWGQSRRKLIE